MEKKEIKQGSRNSTGWTGTDWSQEQIIFSPCATSHTEYPSMSSLLCAFQKHLRTASGADINVFFFPQKNRSFKILLFRQFV